MTWTTPVAGVPGTVITAAWSTANVVDPLNWLRLMTGNADPPGSNYVVVSGSTSSTAWGKVTSDVIADGAITSTKLSQSYLPLVGGVLSGPVRFSTDGTGVQLSAGGNLRDTAIPERTLLTAAGNRFDVFNETGGVLLAMLDASGWFFPSDGQGVKLSEGGILRDEISPERTVISLAGGRLDFMNEAGTVLMARLLNSMLLFPNDATGIQLSSGSQVRDTASPERLILTAAGGRLDVFDEGGGVQLLQVDGSVFRYHGNDISLSGHTHAYLPLTGGTLSGTLLFSTDSTGIQLSSGGQLRDTASPQRTILTAAGDRFDVFNEAASVQLLQVSNSAFVYGGQTVIHSGNIGSQDVASVGGRVPTATPGPGRIPISDASGTLNSWVLGSGIVVPPNVVVGWDDLAANIPAGWTRFTAADGRLLIGDGTSLGVAWTLGTNYGTSWSHDHVTSSVTASSTFSGTGGTTAASGATQQSNVTTPNPAVSLGTHQHTFTPAGTVATTLSGNVGDTSWQPAMRGIIWIKRV
jgi:hypothetical protein